MRKTVLSVLAGCVCGFGLAASDEALSRIDVMVGTSGTGSEYGGMMPAVTVPFGSVHLVPMTRLAEVGRTSYNAKDATCMGLVATRQPAVWMGDWGELSLMPQCGASPDCDFLTRGVPYDHATERISPWRGAVTLGKVACAYSALDHSGIWEFRFPKDETAQIVLDASRDYVRRHTTLRPQEGEIVIGTDGRSAWGWNSDMMDERHTSVKKNFRSWFHVEFSRPFTAFGTYAGGARPNRPPDDACVAPYRTVVPKPGARGAKDDRCGGWLTFAPSAAPLVVRIGFSLISHEDAKANLAREIPGTEVDAVAAASRARWAAMMSRAAIDADDATKTIFYTGLYHAFLYPRDISEGAEGNRRHYSAFDDRVHPGEGYTCFSLWDTYRAEHPLLTLFAPERVDGMMSALVEAAETGGWLPKWPNPGYTGIMTGAPAELVLAEAYAKGFRGFDAGRAYAAMRKNATVPQVGDDARPWRDRGNFGDTPETRAGLTRYMKQGWVASDRTAESVSRTLDFAYADTACAKMAAALGKADDAAFFRARSHNWTNVWCAARQCFWPRKADGTFAPRAGGGDYTECTSETATWCVPYDVAGLVAILGGRDRAEARLDRYFATFFTASDWGGSIHGNEPAHHVAYLYNRMGRPEKTQRMVRRILAECYSADRRGFDGNEDCGQMSAWYVLSALGFYPLDTTTGEYEIGSPCVKGATLTFGAPYKPAKLEIAVENFAKGNVLVESVTFNGVELKDRRIRHADLVAGGKLVFKMKSER